MSLHLDEQKSRASIDAVVRSNTKKMLDSEALARSDAMEAMEEQRERIRQQMEEYESQKRERMKQLEEERRQRVLQEQERARNEEQRMTELAKVAEEEDERKKKALLQVSPEDLLPVSSMQEEEARRRQRDRELVERELAEKEKESEKARQSMLQRMNSLENTNTTTGRMLLPQEEMEQEMRERAEAHARRLSEYEKYHKTHVTEGVLLPAEQMEKERKEREEANARRLQQFEEEEKQLREHVSAGIQERKKEKIKTDETHIEALRKKMEDEIRDRQIDRDRRREEEEENRKRQVELERATMEKAIAEEERKFQENAEMANQVRDRLQVKMEQERADERARIEKLKEERRTKEEERLQRTMEEEREARAQKILWSLEEQRAAEERLVSGSGESALARQAEMDRIQRIKEEEERKRLEVYQNTILAREREREAIHSGVQARIDLELHSLKEVENSRQTLAQMIAAEKELRERAQAARLADEIRDNELMAERVQEAKNHQMETFEKIRAAQQHDAQEKVFLKVQEEEARRRERVAAVIEGEKQRMEEILETVHHIEEKIFKEVEEVKLGLREKPTVQEIKQRTAAAGGGPSGTSNKNPSSTKAHVAIPTEDGEEVQEQRVGGGGPSHVVDSDANDGVEMVETPPQKDAVLQEGESSPLVKPARLPPIDTLTRTGSGTDEDSPLVDRHGSFRN